MKYEINCFYNGGGDAYLLQSAAIHFNHTVPVVNYLLNLCFFNIKNWGINFISDLLVRAAREREFKVILHPKPNLWFKFGSTFQISSVGVHTQQIHWLVHLKYIVLVLSGPARAKYFWATFNPL